MFKTAVTMAMVTSAIPAVAPVITQANFDTEAFNDVKNPLIIMSMLINYLSEALLMVIIINRLSRMID